MPAIEKFDNKDLLNWTGVVLPPKDELRRDITNKVLKNFANDKEHSREYAHKYSNISGFIEAICDADYSENDSEWKMSFEYIDYNHRDFRKLNIKIRRLENDKYSVTIKDFNTSDYKGSKVYKEEIFAGNSNDFCEILWWMLYEPMHCSIAPDLINNIIKDWHVYEVINQKKVQQGWLEWEELRENLWSLQKKIEETKEKINWQWIRWNIEYDEQTSSIRSRNWETVVDDFDGNNMKLVWLDLNLSLEEWLWLANFKNWVEYMLIEKRKNAKTEKYWYGKWKKWERLWPFLNGEYKKWERVWQRMTHTESFYVDYKSSIMNKKFSYKKTLYIDDTMLITREKLEEYIPACSDEKVMKEIALWLRRL